MKDSMYMCKASTWRSMNDFYSGISFAVIMQIQSHGFKRVDQKSPTCYYARFSYENVDIDSRDLYLYKNYTNNGVRVYMFEQRETCNLLRIKNQFLNIVLLCRIN